MGIDGCEIEMHMGFVRKTVDGTRLRGLFVRRISIGLLEGLLFICLFDKKTRESFTIDERTKTERERERWYNLDGPLPL